MKSKRILIVSQYFYPESFRINDIAFSLVKRGHHVDVITGIPNYPKGSFYKGYGLLKKRKEVVEGVNIQRLLLVSRGKNGFRLIINYLSFYMSLAFKMRFMRKRYDMVFAFEVSPMIQVHPITWYTKRKKIPLISYLQDIWPESLEMVGKKPSPLILKRIEKMAYKIYNRSDKILIPSQSMTPWIHRIAPDIESIYEWPQYAEDFYQPTSKKPLDDLEEFEGFTLMFTGNLGYAQGLNQLLEKLATFNESYSFSYRVVLIGDGRAKSSLISLSKELNLEKHIVFLNQKDATLIPNYLAYADVAYLSFSGSELFENMIPAKLQSYMACAKPVFVYAKGISAKIIKEANAGFVLTKDDSTNFNETFKQMIQSSKETLEKMGTQALHYAKTHYDKQKLLDILESEILS